VRKLLPLIVILFATCEAFAKPWDTRCGNPEAGLPNWIAGCTAMIDSGDYRGHELSAAYAQRGHALTLTRDLAHAAEDLDRAVEADSSNVAASSTVQTFFNVAHKPDRALVDAKRALELDSTLPLAYFVRAAAAAQLNDYDGAIADYSTVIKMRPNFAQTYGLRGMIYHKKGDEDRAIADYNDRAQAARPTSARCSAAGDARRKQEGP